VTPFDPAAIVAMLRSFYPVVTIANLRLARTERPDYFAGGALFGTCGEKLRLPDGRVWDLMYDCGGLQAAWQAIEPGPSDGSGGDGFALEPGPFTPIDVPDLLPPTPAQDFTQLMAGAMLELGSAEDVLDLAGTTIGGDGAGAAIGDVLQREFDAAAGAQVSQAHALDDLRPEELLETSAGAGGVIDSEASEYPDPNTAAPESIPPQDPGDPPPDEQPPPEA